MQRTAEDEALRQQLEALLGVGDGNISSQQELDSAESEALKGERAPVVAEFAAKLGFPFSVDELVAVVEAFQKLQTGEMSDQDFAKLIGFEISEEGFAEDMSNLKKIRKWFVKTYLGMN